MSVAAEELKERGNAEFLKQDFQRALEHYNGAVDLMPSNHVYWANRSASKVELKDYDGAIRDAQQAIELLPTWPKGYIRKGIALTKKGQLFMALEAYRSALDLEANETLLQRTRELEDRIYRPRYITRPRRSLEIETNIETCHADVALAFAAGRDIQLSLTTPTSRVRAAIVDHAREYPGWDAPKRRYLFIPCAAESPRDGHLIPRNVEFDPAQGDISRPTLSLLGCQFPDSEVLYSEDGAEMLRGNRDGVGLGYIYRTWEFIMDDNCVATRPLNTLASQLLHRPETYGPVLVLRATHIKSTHDLVQYEDAAADTVAWEVLPLADLETDDWRVKRAEWKELIRRNRHTDVGRKFGNSLASTRLEGLLQGLQGVQVVHV